MLSSYVITVDPEYHAEIVRQIIDFNLTGKQIRELCAGSDLENSSDDPIEKLPAVAIKIARAAHSTSAASANDLVRALLKQEGDKTIAIARLQAFQRLITEAQQLLGQE